MKKISILLTLSFSFIIPSSYAHPYKVKEYEDKGSIRLSFKHASKHTRTTQKYELISLNKEHIESLTEIRQKPEVYTHYADHTCPSKEDVQKTLTEKLLPRVSQNDSLFPFVLRKVIKTPDKTSYEVLGFFNVGTGFKPEDRQFGYYTNPGRKLGEEDVIAQERSIDKLHYENWGSGVGSATLNIISHFVMQFHENAPGTLTLQTKKTVPPQNIPIAKRPFSGVLSSTCDPDNPRSFVPLTKAGLKELSSEEIAQRGFNEEVKSIIQVGEERIPITKKYFEMTWEEFKQNEKNGLYI